MNKNYIVFNDGRVGCIKYICSCSECKKRGADEIFIDDLEGNYLDCIKVNNLKDIIYVGESLQDGIIELVNYYQQTINQKAKEMEYLQSIINFYNKVHKQ